MFRKGKRVSKGNWGETRTRGSFVDETDINKIVNRAKRQGGLPPPAPGKPQPIFGDFSDLPDLAHTLNRVQAANNAFMSLDSYLRYRFRNDPACLLDFIANPANREECVELNLIAPTEADLKKIEDAKKASIQGSADDSQTIKDDSPNNVSDAPDEPQS